MKANSLSKRSGLPPSHPRGNYGHQVDSAAFHGQIASDRLKALTAKELAGAGDVLDTGEAIIVDLIRAFSEWCADQSQGGVPSQFLQQERKVVFAKRDISVNRADDVVF